jgi:O-antigen/teichoic acid export membrane protein
MINNGSIGKVERRTASPTGNSLRARIAHSMFWIAWSRGALQLLGFATTLLVARMLAPADYGVMALAAFWTGTIGMVAEMGLGAAIIQFRDLDRREIDTCFWITMILATAGFVGLVAAAPMISRWFGVPRLADVLPILALVLPLTACRVVSDSLLRKRLAFDRVSQAEVAGGVVTLPVMIGCALGGLGVWTLVIGSLTGPAVRSIFTIAFAPWCPGFRVGGARVKEVIHFSLATLGVKLMWVLREWSNTLVIGKITGSVTLGLYSMAEELALLPGSKVSTVVNMLSSPIMAELQTNVDAMRAAFYRAARLTAAIALPTSTGMALVADEMVAALLGPKWVPAVPLLRLLCLYAAVRAVDVLLPPVLFARHRERFLSWYCLALLFVVPTAAVLGGLWDGAPGVILFSTPVYCAVMAVMAREALAEMNGSFHELWAETWPIPVAALTMAVVVLLVRQFALPAGAEPPWIGLILLAATGAITYGAVLLAIGRPLISEGAEVAGWVLRRRSANV